MLTVFSGCASVTGMLQPPRVTIADIRVEQITLFETVFAIQLRVINPNAVSINVRGADCDLDLMDKHVATGISNAAAEIPAHGTATFPVKVYSSVIDVARSLMALSTQDALTYKVDGKLRLAAGFNLPLAVPFHSSGELSLKSLPK
jgi:LEA14-like dessication related protein